MSTYKATIFWNRNKQPFTDNKYSRAHTWTFDGGIEVPASSSPQVVPKPYSDPSAVDPEEAFLASLSSCHMLWFLNLAAKKRITIDEYRDEAEAIMEEDEHGKMVITRVFLHPQVSYSGEKLPSREQNDQLHQLAHEHCFIANSVRSEIEIHSTIHVRA
jgi:organic hydroperoxide reductase OsmC/OhrA